MTAADRLNEIEARANAATEGPWIVASCENERTVETKHQRWHVASCTSPDNATFIAHARTDVPALVAALRAVLTLADGWQEHAEKVTNVYGKQVVSVEFARAEIVRTIEEALNA